MSDEVYCKLRDFLDRLPGGFPATDSGVEIRLLKRLFTPEEAALLIELKPLPEPVSAIAPRLGLTEKEAEEKLESLARQGSIFRVRRKGLAYYMALSFAVGIYEFHLNSIDRELSELMEEYIPHLRELWIKTRTKQLRVVPINSALDSAPAVGNYHQARELVKAQDYIAVAECICRKEQGLLGHECSRTHETCLTLGYSARYYVENGMGRRISVEEALEILDLAEKEALVLSPSNAEKTPNICCCCGCCCGILRGLKEMPRPADYVHSPFQARIDPDLCSACGTCVERCQVDAIIEDEVMEVDTGRCIGCGLCVPTCPEDAISLVEKPDQDPVPKDMVDMGVRILKDRGLL